jgi:hypothetical protein
MELDRAPLWRGDYVSVRQLCEDFGRYPYLPRLTGSDVLLTAIEDGVRLLLWRHETFAYADSFDEASERYRGLRGGQSPSVAESGLVVKPDVAARQLDEQERPGAPGDSGSPEQPGGGATEPGPGASGARSVAPRRFYGSVQLDPSRVGRDAGQIAEEVIAHLAGLVGANVTVSLEIHAEVPNGIPDTVVRTVTENSRTLKFTSQGFEED